MFLNFSKIFWWYQTLTVAITKDNVIGRTIKFQPICKVRDELPQSTILRNIDGFDT